MSSLSLDRDNLANYLKKRVSTTASEAAFDYSKLDRSCTAPYYGDNLSPSSLSPAKVSSFHAGKYANPQTRKISCKLKLIFFLREDNLELIGMEDLLIR